MTDTVKGFGVYEAISFVQAELASIGIKKDKKNAQQGYNFRGIDDVYDVLAPVLAKARLCILPRVMSRQVTERQTQKGGVLFYVVVECEFDLVYALDGSIHTIKTYGEAMDSADKATNKAMSAAYKYAAFQTFCIPVDVEDADATTPEPIKPKVVEPKKEPPEPEETLPIGTELRTKVDGLIADSGIDPKEFKKWLAQKGKIGKKFGNPSLSTMSVENANKMVAAWEKTLASFAMWVDKKNA